MSCATHKQIQARDKVVLPGKPAGAFHLSRRGALGYDGAGGRSVPRRMSIGG